MVGGFKCHFRAFINNYRYSYDFSLHVENLVWWVLPFSRCRKLTHLQRNLFLNLSSNVHSCSTNKLKIVLLDIWNFVKEKISDNDRSMVSLNSRLQIPIFWGSRLHGSPSSSPWGLLAYAIWSFFVSFRCSMGRQYTLPHGLKGRQLILPVPRHCITFIGFRTLWFMLRSFWLEWQVAGWGSWTSRPLVYLIKILGGHQL